MHCDFCGGTRLIQTENGYKCRVSTCEGFKSPMKTGIICEQCGEKMDYKGMNSWGEPSYRCPGCGHYAKL